MEPKHSALGIASFVISIVTTILIFLLFIVAGAIEAATPGGISEESSEAIVIGLLIIFMLLVNMVAFGLGIGGMCQQNRKKIFAILGTIFSSVTTLLAILLIIVGNMS